MNMPISYHSATGLEEQVRNRFKQADLSQEYTRAILIRSQAIELASQYGIDLKQVSTAALLLNISRLIPEQDYVKLAEEYGVEILPEERQNPHLLHQKISRILAVEEFNISDKEVLNAIACHTTLRPSATLLDKIIFIASKQNNTTTKDIIFKSKKKIATEQELNRSVFSYLFNEVNNCVSVVHPLAQKAMEDLNPQKNKSA